jgi:hypothetical protein
MIAQDTGGAIRGPQRADIFFGFGDEAGTAAGTIRDPGAWSCCCPSNARIRPFRTRDPWRGGKRASQPKIGSYGTA